MSLERTDAAPRTWLPFGWALLGFAALALFGLGLYRDWPAPDASIERLVLLYSTLPRGAVALLAGASLGLSGALLQRALRNPIADPSTLGVLAGAQLAMTVATIYAPVLMTVARGPVAFAGGALALLLVLSLSLRRGLDPVTVVLSGMLVSMIAAALSATIILANGEYMLSLFIWGGGSLEQQSWWPSLSLLLSLAAAAVAAALLSRPLTLMALDDTGARALGLPVQTTRLLTLGLAVSLAASVTSEVGIIGFVGLAAPNLARLAGARTLRQILLAAPAIGAVLLLATDGVIQAVAFGGRELVPTGAATALLGGPLLLWLLPRLKVAQGAAQSLGIARRALRPMRILVLLALSLVVVATIALFLGHDGAGWVIASGETLQTVLPWRWPRILAGAAAGAMLAAAGCILQRVTGNPMASPEVLGVSSGAGVGLAIVLLAFGTVSRQAELLGAIAGSVGALVVVLAISTRHRFGPERLLLSGVAVGALSGAVVNSIVARGGPESMQLLNWASGSTLRVAPADALVVTMLAVALVAPLPFLLRWLTILPLGATLSRGLGLARARAAGSLILLAAVLSAVATLTVGPLSFVGLMAPHLARLAGFARPGPQLAAALLIGAILMILADFLARTVSFPYQLPLGLFASLIGGPYLIFILNRRASSR